MKKASHVLGVIAGVLALVGAGFCIVAGVLFAVFAPSLAGLFAGFIHGPVFQFPSMLDLMSMIGGIAFILVGLITAAIGILSLVGANNVNKNNVKAGVLMLVAAGLSIFTGYGWVLTVLCVLGGVFALVKEKAPGNTPPPPQG